MSADTPSPVIIALAIPENLHRQRLDKALTDIASATAQNLSRARLQALIAEGQVQINGHTITQTSHKVTAGEVYQLSVPPAASAIPEAQNITLDIIYEDDDLIVINKPAGMVVHPAPGNRDKTLVNALLAHCGTSLSGIGGVARPGIVHRLDKDTSGLMVVAKNDLAHHGLTRQFADRSLSRTYQALVWGLPMPSSGSIDACIGRHPRDRKKMAVTSAQKGKTALTHYRVLEDYDEVSLVECKLETGRTHQIRVHLAHLKHPVVGDTTYGSHRNPGKYDSASALRAFPRQALHAIQIQFIHPRTGKKMRFKVDLAEDMRKLIRKL